MQIFKYDGTIYPAGGVWKIKLALPQMFFGLRPLGSGPRREEPEQTRRSHRQLSRPIGVNTELARTWTFEEPVNPPPSRPACRENYVPLSEKEVSRGSFCRVILPNVEISPTCTFFNSVDNKLKLNWIIRTPRIIARKIRDLSSGDSCAIQILTCNTFPAPISLYILVSYERVNYRSWDFTFRSRDV